MKSRKLLLMTVFAIVLMATNAFSAQLLVNGGFEQGLLGWTTQENATSTDYFAAFGVGISPYEGSRMAYLGVSGTETSANASLGQLFSTTGYESPATLSFAYNLWAYDFSSTDGGSDRLQVLVSGSIGDSTIFNFLEEYPLNDPRTLTNNVPTVTGWIFRSYTYLDPLPQGVFSLTFTLANAADLGGDPGQKFKAFVDDVSIEAVNPVPEPGTMILLGSGLVGLAGWGRKKFRQ